MNKKRIRIFINDTDENNPKIPLGYDIKYTLEYIKKIPKHYYKKYY